MNNIKNYEFRKYFRLVNYIFLLVLVLMNISTIVATLSRIIKIFRPVLIAVVMAFIVNIPMSIIEDSLKKNIDKKSRFYSKIRIVSYFLALVFLVIVITIAVNLVVPELTASIKALIANIALQSELIDLDGIIANLGIDADWIATLDINTLLEQGGLTTSSITSKLTSFLTNISGGLLAFLTSAGSTLLDWMLGAFISIYLTLKKEESLSRMHKLMIAIMPSKFQRVVFNYLKTYNIIFEMFVGKRLLESAILGFIEYLGCIAFKIPYAALIAVLTVVLSIIPYFGCLVVVVIGWVLIAPVSFAKSIIFIVVFEIITTFESNVIYPKVVGKSLGLPEVWTLIGLTFFGAIWGFMGMLIAAPVTACIYITIQDFVHYRYSLELEKEQKEKDQLNKELDILKKKQNN